MTLIVGLTGGIATGKSTVTQMFKSIDIPVIETDIIAREMLKKGTEGYEEVLKCFSTNILLTNNEINRKKLAMIVFGNPQRRKKLNDIVHPRVRSIVINEIQKHKELGTKMLVLDVPLLFETTFIDLVDKTVVVYTTYKKQKERLMERERIDKDYAELKISAQMPLNRKVDLADYVINNSASILDTRKEFNKIIKELGVL
ncbi:MAG: dephospho-CoA kinase [Candidatus Izimaplasma sp.]|nr:dephospho-CoA kinase [Candidatus Izimaplasma bacterium]